MKRRLSILVASIGLFTSASVAAAATITLDYNGFNPGEEVTLRSAANAVLNSQAANVAGDTASSFTFDLVESGDYIVDLFGNVANSAGRATHRIRFSYDHTLGQVTSVSDGSDKVLDFVPGTALTLRTVAVYIDPQGYNPANDNNDGYRVQAEVGSSGRIDLGDSLTHTNTGTSMTLVNGLQYMAQYGTSQNQHRQNFIISGGMIQPNTGLLGEGTTVDESGAPGGSHQLVRVNRKPITIDTNGLSHAIDVTDDKRYTLNTLPAGFNGSVDVLAGNPGEYAVFLPRLLTPDQALFDVGEDGGIVGNADDPRYAFSGDTVTLRTVTVRIDVPEDHEADDFDLTIKQAASSANRDVLLADLSGDLDLTLLPLNVDGATAVYLLDGGQHEVADSRDSWLIAYDADTDSFSLTTWTDEQGNEMVTGLQSVTTYNGGYTITLIPEPASLVLLGAGAFLAAGRRRPCSDNTLI